MPHCQLALAGYAAVALLLFLKNGGWFMGPFLLVYVVGLSWMGIQELMEQRDDG